MHWHTPTGQQVALVLRCCVAQGDLHVGGQAHMTLQQLHGCTSTAYAWWRMAPCVGRPPQGAPPGRQIPVSALHAKSLGMPLLSGQAILQTPLCKTAASLNLF